MVFSEQGSMERNILAAYMKHFYAVERCFVSAKETFLLCLDGRTSHFHKLCEQHIKKKFHDRMNEIRDEFCRQSHVDTSRVNFNLACVVYSWKDIGAKNVSNAFDTTRLFPFQRKFAARFRID